MIPVPGRPARPPVPPPTPPQPPNPHAGTNDNPPPPRLPPPTPGIPPSRPVLPIPTAVANPPNPNGAIPPPNNLMAELRQRAAQARPPPLPVFTPTNANNNNAINMNNPSSGLGNDRVRTELTRTEVSPFGRARELHETLMRNVRNQIQTIQTSEHLHSIETFVRQIRRLHPAPSSRISHTEAKQLLQTAQRFRDIFPSIDDDDIWIMAVNWPRSQLERLQEGVNSMDRIYKDLHRQKERIHDTEKLRHKSSVSLIFPVASSASSSDSNVSLESASSSSTESSASSSSTTAASSTLSSLPPIPLATARNLETIGNGLCHTAQLLYRAIDTSCCYITDESKELMGQILDYLVRGTDFILEALENLAEKLKMGGGTKWDINSRIQQAHSIAEALLSIHRQSLNCQRHFALCHGRRSTWDDQTYLRVANNISVYNTGQLGFLDRDIAIEETEEEREQYRRIGAYDAYLEDENGQPYILGALSESAALFVEEITTGGFNACTAEKIATAYSRYLERGRLEGYQRIRPRGTKMTDGTDAASSGSANVDNPLSLSSLSNEEPSMSNEEKRTVDTTLTRILELMRSGHTKTALTALHESIEAFYVQDPTNTDKVPPILTAMSSSGMTIARAAASHGYAPILHEVFTHKYNLLTDVAGGTILHAIAGKGGQPALDMLRTLLEVYSYGKYTSSLSNSLPSGFLDNVNSGGITAMHLFARHSVSTRSIAAQCLLEMVKAGADPSVQGSQRKTPLQSFVEAHLPKEMIQVDKVSVSTVKPTTVNTSASPIFSSYLYNPRLSDVTLIVPSANSSIPHKLPAHAIILAAQSQFFKVILEENSWAESVTKQIDLTTNPNLSESTIRKILTYLYTGHIDLIPGDAKMGLEILYAANLYSIHTLIHDLQIFLITSCLNNNTSWAIFDTLTMLRGGSPHHGTNGNSTSTTSSSSSSTTVIDELLRIQISAAHHILLHYHEIDMQHSLPIGPEGAAQVSVVPNGILGNHYALQQILTFFHETSN